MNSRCAGLAVRLLLAVAPLSFLGTGCETCPGCAARPAPKPTRNCNRDCNRDRNGNRNRYGDSYSDRHSNTGRHRLVNRRYGRGRPNPRAVPALWHG